MRIYLPWHNLMQHRWQTVIASAGIALAVVLMFMQLGFHAATARSATALHDAMTFDLALVSPTYQVIGHSGAFPRARLQQALTCPGVRNASALRLAFRNLRNVQSGGRTGILLIGLDLEAQPFALQEITAQLPKLTQEDAVLMDALSVPDCGPQDVGLICELDHGRVQLVGSYRLGAGFVAPGCLLMSTRTFTKLNRSSPVSVQIGLLTLEDGCDQQVVAKELRQRLGADVRVMTRQQLLEKDRKYMMEIRPVGLIFTSGVGLGFLVGTATLYQILNGDVTRRLREFATMKALGFSDGHIYRIVLQQGMLYTGVGFFTALPIAHILHESLREKAAIPAYLTLSQVLFVAAMAILMCASVGFLALGKVRRADPADLF